MLDKFLPILKDDDTVKNAVTGIQSIVTNLRTGRELNRAQREMFGGYIETMKKTAKMHCLDIEFQAYIRALESMNQMMQNTNLPPEIYTRALQGFTISHEKLLSILDE